MLPPVRDVKGAPSCEGREGWGLLLSQAVRVHDAASCSTGETPRPSAHQQSQFTEVPEERGRVCVS